MQVLYAPKIRLEVIKDIVPPHHGVCHEWSWKMRFDPAFYNDFTIVCSILAVSIVKTVSWHTRFHPVDVRVWLQTVHQRA
jgi:hypothetical protein